MAVAQSESDVEVRCQLAATAKRLPAETAVPLVVTLIKRDDVAGDIYIPKTLWWALEAHADDHDRMLSAIEGSEHLGIEFRSRRLLARREPDAALRERRAAARFGSVRTSCCGWRPRTKLARV